MPENGPSKNRSDCIPSRTGRPRRGNRAARVVALHAFVGTALLAPLICKQPCSKHWKSSAVIFPAQSRSVDPRSGITRRHHVDPSPVNQAIAMGLPISSWDTPHIGMNPHHHRRSLFSPLQGFRGDSTTARNGNGQHKMIFVLPLQGRGRGGFETMGLHPMLRCVVPLAQDFHKN
jgi:hypothetical protein